MAWEKRGDRFVYYSARRVGRRVVKEYLGSGPLAQSASALVDLERREREARRAQEEVQREADEDLEAQARRLDGVIARLLQSAGLHRPKRGPWRRRRAPGSHREGGG